MIEMDQGIPIEGDTHEALRLRIARQDVPRVLVFAGILACVLSASSYVVDPTGGLIAHVADFPMGVLCVAVGLLLRRLPLPDIAYPRIFATMATLFVFALLEQIWRAPAPIAMTYVLLVMCAFGPATLAWWPFGLAASAMVWGTLIVSQTWAGTEWIDWTIVSVVAIVIGAVLLSVRMRSVDLLADATLQIQRIATTDELTGLLNRHGLTMQLVPFLANAARLNQALFVAFIDIDGLKAANDHFGHDFGDEVITCVAHSVVGVVREGDLVARWGGDEIIVVGLGAAPDESVLPDRLLNSIARSSIDLTKWTGRVSIGIAQAGNDRADIDQLIHAADEDMYRRRLAR